MKNIIFFFAVWMLASYAFPQQSNWRNYSNMKSTSDIAVSSDGIWAATSGGAFFYNQTKDDFETYGKYLGLNGTSLTAVGIDKYNKVWFGSVSGIIDIYDPEAKSFHSILDIFNSDKASKSINGITIDGDSVYLAMDYGISLIDSKSNFFYATFFKFGSFTSNIKVNKVLVADLIYAATVSGVAIQKAGETNLLAPESWNVYSQTDGLGSSVVNDIEFYNNSLIAATDAGLSIFNGSSWQTFIGVTGIKIIDLLKVDNNLYILTANTLLKYDGISLTQIWTTNSSPVRLAYQSGKGLIAATNNGLFIDEIFISPNGPQSNQFINTIVDGEGNFWSASGKDVTGAGFYKFDGNSWINYNTTTYPDVYTNACYEIFSSSDNTIYGGTWGQGFLRMKGDKIERFHGDNTNIVGIPNNNDTDFVVISGFAEDSKSNIWILNLRAADKNTLGMLTSDSIWYFFQIPEDQVSGFTEHLNLVIDPNGTKWLNINSDSKTGLVYFNEKGTYKNTADDVYGYLTTSSGLRSNSIFSIVVDRRGDLWVGTSLGVNIISNLSSIVSSSNPQLKISYSFPVRQQIINSIAVDPLNQKWVGTNQGLFLLSSDGTQLLATLNSRNSPLLSDNIISVAVDEKTGRVYAGSDEGLTSFDTPAILPVESFNGLNIFPSPYILKDGSQLVTIDGLIRDTDIKVVTISGKLIKEFSSPGGRTAFWDGRDEEGNLVASGVYIVIAFDKEGNNVETGKIAVIRE